MPQRGAVALWCLTAIAPEQGVLTATVPVSSPQRLQCLHRTPLCFSTYRHDGRSRMRKTTRNLLRGAGSLHIALAPAERTRLSLSCLIFTASRQPRRNRPVSHPRFQPSHHISRLSRLLGGASHQCRCNQCSLVLLKLGTAHQTYNAAPGACAGAVETTGRGPRPSAHSSSK